MTLRDYFAGQVLAGVLASECTGDGLLPAYKEPREQWMSECAKSVWEWADAMLAARERKETT